MVLNYRLTLLSLLYHYFINETVGRLKLHNNRGYIFPSNKNCVISNSKINPCRPTIIYNYM